MIFTPLQSRISPEATLTPVSKTSVWKWGISKRGILQSSVSHVLNFTGWIKLIFNTVDLCYFVINQFNPTFEVQRSGNKREFSNQGLQLPLGRVI